MDQEWMDEEETAAWMKVSPAAVNEAVAAGVLPAFTFGNTIRISRSAVLALAVRPVATALRALDGPPPSMETKTESNVNLPQPAGLMWIEDLSHDPNGFDYGWPMKGGGKWTETYTEAWHGGVSIHGDRLTVQVGVCSRDSQMSQGGRTPRRRLSVFFKWMVQCEFAETKDGECWASTIKPDGKKVLAAGTPPPPLYCGARLVPYREATGMIGQGVPGGVSVVIVRDDLHSAVYHAAARWLGRRHLPVEPAK